MLLRTTIPAAAQGKREYSPIIPIIPAGLTKNFPGFFLSRLAHLSVFFFLLQLCRYGKYPQSAVLRGSLKKSAASLSPQFFEIEKKNHINIGVKKKSNCCKIRS